MPHPDGTPKNSVYISIYRVLEHIPTSALGKLYLSTAYGHTLGLERGDRTARSADPAHVPGSGAGQQPGGQRAGPSELLPKRHQQAGQVHSLPALCFVELGLGALASDPENGPVGDLPYSFMHHLREALMELEPNAKQSKLVHRVHSWNFRTA